MRQLDDLNTGIESKNKRIKRSYPGMHKVRVYFMILVLGMHGIRHQISMQGILNRLQALGV